MHIPATENVEEFIEHQDELLPFTAKHLGKNNLDVGCGNGVASYVHAQKLGIHPTLADVSDIRYSVARAFPFALIENNTLSFEDKSFDSAYMQYVLHHIPTEDVQPLFSELCRVAKKIVLVEEVLGPHTNVEKAKAFDEEVNSRIHAGVHMPVYHYYSPEEIQKLCTQFGKSVKEEKVIFLGEEDHGYLETRLFVIE